MKIWGARGSIPTPGPATQRYGGNTTCIEVRVDDTLFICDAGTGLRELGLDLLRRNEGQITEGHWLFSHTHWDHIQGFPFFLPAYDSRNRFHVYGRVEGDSKVFDILSGQMSRDYFPVDFSELAAPIVASDLESVKNNIKGVTVRWYSQHHDGGSYAYSFEKDGYKFVFSTDNELDQCFEDPDAVQGNLRAHRPIEKGFLDFIRGADLLIADGQYTESEYPAKVGWGHPRATTIVDAAVEAEVKQLAITHHDPMHTDRAVEEKLAQCTERARQHKADLTVFGARESLEIKVAG